jgi:hypothetical protein
MLAVIVGRQPASCAGAVLTVAVLAAVGSGTAAVTRPSPVDARLVGTWTRAITSADVKRSPGSFVFLAGKVAILSIVKSGRWKLDEGLGPNLGHVDGTIEPAGASRIHLNTSGEAPNVYAWRVAERRLTIIKVKDPNPNSAAVFWAVWNRK